MEQTKEGTRSPRIPCSTERLATRSNKYQECLEPVRTMLHKLKSCITCVTFSSKKFRSGGPINEMISSPMLSSFSGNSTVSLTVFGMGPRLALAVSRKGRFHPWGRGPWFCPWAIMLGSICSWTTFRSEDVPLDSFPATTSDRL